MSPSHASGSGPGVLTRDGCAVEVYARLLPGADCDLIHAALSGGASVLDLGAGAGRLANALARLGHEVLAVDESPDMLAQVRGATTVCSSIEDLHLDRTFDAVLLASNLVNVPADPARRRLLETCRRHVQSSGVVIIERMTRTRVDTAENARGEHQGVDTELTVTGRPDPGLLSATVTYRIEGRSWTHSCTMRGLDDEDLDHDLRNVGLRFERRLSADGGWVTAVVG